MQIHDQFELFIEGLDDPTNATNIEKYPEWISNIIRFVKDFQSEEQIHILKTSGSTGPPKFINVEKSKMVGSARMTGKFLRLEAGQTSLLCLPASFVAGKMMLVRAMILGLKIYCVEPKTKLDLSTHFDFCAMVPMQVEKNIESLNQIKKLIIGGGLISKKLQNQLNSLNHVGLFHTYGMTETLSHIAMRKLNEVYFNVLDNIEISYGPENTLQIFAPDLSNQIIKSNDIVEIVSPTSFRFLGRLDNTINSGGIKINPEKVEEILSDQISNPFFIAGLKDNSLGERVVLFIEGEHQKVNFDSLSKYERPKKVVFMDSFFRTKTGKIQRRKTVSNYLSEEQ